MLLKLLTCCILQRLAKCSVDLWRLLCHSHSDTAEIPALHDSHASAYLKLANTLQLHAGVYAAVSDT